MLEFEIFNKDLDNGWLVRQIEAFRFSGDTIADKFIPRPYLSIVFHVGDCPRILDSPPKELDPFFVAPIVPKAFELEFHGQMDSFMVHCNSTVFSRCLGLDLSPVPGRSINLPRQQFLPLWESMYAIQGTKERIDLFTAFINSLQITPYKYDSVDLLYNTIIDMGVKRLLKDLLLECPNSRSTIFRKFVKRAGVSTKTLMRIVRLDYLWTMIKDGRTTDYLDIAFDNHYFDQSHFIKDFKAIIGETPNHFFKRNLEIVKDLSQKNTDRQYIGTFLQSRKF